MTIRVDVFNMIISLFFCFQMVKEKLNSSNEGSMINKGKTGTWKEMMSDELVKRFEAWEAKWLKDTDLKFVYEV